MKINKSGGENPCMVLHKLFFWVGYQYEQDPHPPISFS